KRGWNLANLARQLGNDHNVLSRRLDDMTVESCPLPGWNGGKLEAPYQRLLAWQAGAGQALDAAEEAFFQTFPGPAGDDADFILHLLRHWDTRLRWHTTTANR